VGRAARSDARRARAGRGHPDPGPIPAALTRSPADRPLLHARRVRRAAPARPRDGVSPRGSGTARPLELPRVGAGGAGDRIMATAATRTAKPSAQTELERRMLRQMLLIRRFEEKAAEAYALGKIGGVCHLYIGQEAGAGGSPAPLRGGDYAVSSYPEHGQALARGGAAHALMAGLFGKGTGCSQGKGGSMPP